MDPTSDKILPGDSIEKIEGSLERVDELLSAYLDDELEAEAFEELNATLDADDNARRRCIETVSLHIDLLNYFGNQQVVTTNFIK